MDTLLRRAYSALLLALIAGIAPLSSPLAQAQHRGAPGKFDFYLLNLAWSPEFCSTHGTSPECAAKPGFIVHGLWPQNNNGTWPVYCSERPGPANPRVNLDITPDLSLLKHEWAKHGVCTTLTPTQFFALEHQAYRNLAIPEEFEKLNHEVLLKPQEITRLFAGANPSYPAGSILVSCGNNRLTAIEACLSKDGLKPIVCQGLRECHAQVVRITPPTTN